MAIENDIRGLLRNFWAQRVVGAVRFDDRIRDAFHGSAKQPILKSRKGRRKLESA